MSCRCASLADERRLSKPGCCYGWCETRPSAEKRPQLNRGCRAVFAAVGRLEILEKGGGEVCRLLRDKSRGRRFR
jgi:hypothetical protein